MDLNKISERINKQEMNRKEFLASLGAVALSLVGVSSVMKAFDLHGHKSVSSGYGSSAYGGGTERKA